MVITKILKKLSIRWWLLVGAALAVIFSAGLWRQNVVALHALHTAQRQDASGEVMQAAKTLAHVSRFLVLPHIRQRLQMEHHHNQQLVDTNNKIVQAKQLLKEHKTGQALALLNTLPHGSVAPSIQTQVNTLKNIIQQTTPTSNSSSTPTKSTTGGSATVGTGSGSGGGTSGGGSGGTGGGTTSPPPPSPMSGITVSAFSATPSSYSASECHISDSVTFSVNGTGSVSVKWKMLSTKTSSAINNPVTYSFAAAGSQTDGMGIIAQGLEAGDSYRVSAIITDQSNGSVTTTAGPVTISSCASPPALLSAQEPSSMTHITPGAVNVSQSQDGIFTNECSVTLTTPFSVDGSGTVQAVYTITSGSSGGVTLYANTVENFTAAGSDTDTSYVRLHHLISGDMYTITARLIDVGDQTVYATASSVTSGCA